MMRRLLPLFLCAATSAAQAFPVPSTPERAVSAIVRTGAAGAQYIPQVATNGDMTLVAWVDTRDGVNGSVYAARIDAAGNVLDPLGVRIRDLAPLNAVVWNGQSFIIVMGLNLAFVAPDMTVTIQPAGVEPEYVFQAATTGPDVRLLYLTQFTPSGRAAIIDRNGVAFTRKTVWTNSQSEVTGPVYAGGNENGFLVLRYVVDNLGGGVRTVADRLDRDGNVISSKNSGLPLLTGLPTAIAGGEDGFLVVRTGNGVTAERLDASGVFTGKSRVLETASTLPASVARDDNRYVIAWQTIGGNETESIAEIGLDDSFSIRHLSDLGGRMGGIAVAANRGRRILASSVNRPGFGSAADLFVRSLSPALEPGEARLVAESATPQTSTGIAAGANGFAVSWTETGPDAYVRIYVRRFSESGVPQDAAPIPAYALPVSLSSVPLKASIVSNGETYLLGWLAPDGAYIRRLAARSGSWLDPIPLPLGVAGNVRLASNGVDAVALADGGSNLTGMLTARRIHLSGEPLTSPAVVVKSFQSATSADIAIASNGTDYLAAWFEVPVCFFPCGPIPTQVYATRLRADATVIDAVPLPLDNFKRNQFRVSVASAAGRYLVVWTSGDGVRGSRVTAEGAVLDRDTDGGGVLLEGRDNQNDIVNVVAMPLQDRFALLFRHDLYSSSSATATSTLKGVAFDANVDLSAAAALPRTTLLAGVDNLGRSFEAAPRGPSLGVVYDRRQDGEAGGVGRVFFRLLLEAPRRRATAH